MSASCLVLLRRELGGELVAALGIEVLAPGAALGSERCGPQDGSEDTSALCAQSLLGLFGGELPFGVSPMQRVTVVHHGLDLREVLGEVPGDSGDRGGRGVHGCCCHG